MTLSFFQRLSYRLARASLFVVLTLGLLVTVVQVYLDFRSQNRAIDLGMRDIIEVSAASAQRSVHILDNDDASEVIKGLLTYPFILSAEILDERGNIMAQARNPARRTSTGKLTKFIRGKTTDYSRELKNDEGLQEGTLNIVVDNDQTLRPLYERAFYTLLSGVLRNIILALVLAYVFHWLLSRPLFQLASNISQIDYREPKGKRLTAIENHLQDEIGHIVTAVNALIYHVENHQLAVQERERQLRVILDSSPNQVFALDPTGKFVFSNNATNRFFQQVAHSGQHENYFSLLRQSGKDGEALIELLVATASKDKPAIGVEHPFHHGDGERSVLQMTIMPFALYGQCCTLVIANDISARVAAEERIEKLAYYDSLTNLPNRNQLHERLVDDIQLSKSNKRYGAVLFIDIDDFKRINDTLGHSIGDELLLQLSLKMRKQLRDKETLGRLGGDEFILSIPNVDESEANTLTTATQLATRLLSAISAPVELKGHYFSIGASIGIAIYCGANANVEQVLRHADTAMYQAKAAGRNCYRVFEPPMEEEALNRIEMESQIRQALSKSEFNFYLQPLVGAATHLLYGAEALIRWHHPERGVVSPGEFIPFLEQSPMISQVGAQLLDQVCAFIRKGLDESYWAENLRISVNLSATELFQPSFVDQVRFILKRNNISGKYLEFEITESVALEGFDNVSRKINELRQDGIHFALDDFGTGFSSLNYLKRLPVDKIKIDRSFIEEVPANAQDAAIVGSVIEIAETLNLTVVVEGVEDRAQAEYFGLLERVVIQGYWFDAPMPPDRFVQKYLQQKHSEKI